MNKNNSQSSLILQKKPSNNNEKENYESLKNDRSLSI